MRALLKRLWAAPRAFALYVTLLAAGWIAGETFLSVTIPEMRPMNEPLIHRLVMGSLVLFVVTAAIPFVPGAEIGFALLLMFGGKASPIVYAGMVGALVLSFSIARFVPLHSLARLSFWLRLRRTASFVDALAKTPRHERPKMISEKLNSRLSHLAVRNRYVVLALLLNLPVNSVIGGGGGLAFMAGLSGIYSFWAFLITVLIAVAPFPLMFVVLEL
ncbi:hypothetical protein AB2B41_16700 [Marimonas sp. MJW-29]|uniref:TVP38/TMEM64 family membrane protein n=1 Tax=Sulfitobacter sediminis TaxID=3234186 RepID=A0ABV3RT73_9RHOB